MSKNNIKKQIENELSVLIGERIRQIRRVVLMIGIDFGDDVEYKHLVGAKRGEISIIPKFSLHIHSSWRLLKDGNICLGQSDLFNRIDGEFKLYKNDSESMYNIVYNNTSRKLNELFDAKSMKVINVEANELGDLKIYIENDYCLELFVDSIGNNESWRFFRNDEDFEHFVVFGEGEI